MRFELLLDGLSVKEKHTRDNFRDFCDTNKNKNAPVVRINFPLRKVAENIPAHIVQERKIVEVGWRYETDIWHFQLGTL
jgi:hypothetical protein